MSYIATIGSLAALLLPVPPADAATKVFLLGGQSNMAGYGTVADLSEPYDAPLSSVKFWKAASSGWIPLQGGLGSWGGLFGPELTFGHEIHEMFPDDDIYLVKYAVGGSNLAVDWKPDGSGPCYKSFKSTVTAAMQNLSSAHHSPTLAGMIWMQGEGDASDHTYAAGYAANLNTFITKVRSDFSTPDMPFVVGRIMSYPQYPFGTQTDNATVRTAQAMVPGQVGHASWIDTDNLDVWPIGSAYQGHFDTRGQIDLGIRFANALTPLPEPGAMVLLATSLIGLLAYAWRKRRCRAIAGILLALLSPGLQTTAHAAYDGKYVAGAGDAAALQRLDQSFQFFHANPDVPNLSMLYRPDWNAFAEGAGWQGWWIQNSYGFSYAASPFLQPCYRVTLQNSLDMFWNNQGDGVRKGKFGDPGTPGYDLVGPDGALGDCATPNGLLYKQGDGDLKRHDWFYEATAAGVVMQTEILLTSRDRQAIAKYFPKMERACNHIETARDPSNNLFLVGPASNLLAPSFGGIQQPNGTFGKAYLAGLSITYLAAVERMVELYKLTGNSVKQAQYQHRADMTRASLAQLTTTGAQGKYFVKSVEKAATGLGTKHGVFGQSKFGYLEGVTNADAVALRVADDATAQSIYNTIAATTAIRPNNFLLTNSSGLDDTMWHYGSTKVTDLGTSYLQFGDWVNGGAWGTVEGRAILAYARLGKFDDITLSAERAMKWSKDFRMDAPFTQGGANTRNYWSDPGGPMAGSPAAVMVDNFAIPAATLRGLFDYEYRSDRLILRPRVPGEITQYVQNEPVYFGDKRIFLTCTNGGPNVTSVTVNGVAVNVSSSTEVALFYDSLPVKVHVQIVTGGGWPVAKLQSATVASFTTAAPSPLSDSLRTPYRVLKTISRLLAQQPNADYERSFVDETLRAIHAWQVSCATDRGSGIYRSMTPEKVAAINDLYHTTALNMYKGLAGHMAKSALSSLWTRAVVRSEQRD
jgi:hypothetical protein